MPHVDILEEQDRIGKPLLASVGLHAGIAALLAAVTLAGPVRKIEQWGEPTSFGGSVAVKTTATIPLPRREGPVNPVADDTESRVPTPPAKAKETRKERTPSKDAIEIQDRASKKSERWASRRYQPEAAENANQLYSTSGRRLVSELYGKQGSGGVGVGADSPLGNRFGAYASLLQQIIGSKWNTADVDSRLRTAPPAKVQFTILRDGSVRDIQLAESSGNRVLDTSAMRAVYDAGRLPGLPPAYERDQARIEFWFELKR